MKKLNKLIIGLLTLSLIAPSCKKSFIETNTNPNNLNSTLPQYLFAGATTDLNSGRGQIEARYKFMVYMQYIVPRGSNALLGDNFDNPTLPTGNDPGISYYNDYFSGIGLGMSRIIAQIDAMPAAQKATYANIRAISVILDTYHAWQVADIYGALPYTQAFNGTKYPLPVYDYDFTLYKTFDAQLKASANTLKSAQTGQVNLGIQDFFYGGDVPSWLAFANTLRIKIAQRYEKRDAANLAAVLTDLQTNFGNDASTVISSNAQSFGVNNTKNDNTDTNDINIILHGYDAGYAFVEYLKSTKDARLPLLIRQNDFGPNSALYNTVLAANDPTTIAFIKQVNAQPDSGRYYGKHAFPASENDPAYGLTGGDRSVVIKDGSSTISLDYLSVVQGCYFIKGAGFINNISTSEEAPHLHTGEPWVSGFDPTTVKMRQLWLSYGETCFMMAEIATKSGGAVLGKSGADWYNAGVQASFTQYKTLATAYGIPAYLIPATLTSYPAYQGSQQQELQQIYSQEWVHDMMEPENSYAMWKRTGYPAFVDYRAGQPTTTGNIGDGSGIAYLENLWNGSLNLVVPRRAQFAEGNSGAPLNGTNFFKAISTMQAKDASYGASGTDTKGRIWWDQQ